MRAERERAETSNLQASGDLDALRLLVATAAEHSLPDEYEVKVTVGFMRDLASRIEKLEAAPQPPLARTEGNMAGVLHQEQADHLRRAARPAPLARDPEWPPSECVCAETSTRNCPVHQNAGDPEWHDLPKEC